MPRTRAKGTGGTAIQSGLLANRPAFGIADRYYYATDVYDLFRDTGATWEKVGGTRYARYLDTLFKQRSGAVAIAIGKAYLTPIQILETVTIDMLVVTVIAAAGNVRVGLYNDNGLVPDGGALIVESAAVVAAVGKLECAIANTRLTPALYWLATQHNDVALTRITSNPAPSDTTGVAPRGRSYAQAFGAFTTPCPATVTADSVPLGKLRVLSIP